VQHYSKTIETPFKDDVINDSTPNVLTTTNIVASAIDSFTTSTIAATPVKKKLRVVHVNEIGQPAEESTANKNNNRHGFELRIINNEIYNPSAAPANNGLILFKSRITSN